MIRTMAIALALLVLTGIARAVPDSTLSTPRTSLGISTMPDSGWVYIDGAFAGRAPVRIDTLPPGRHILHIVHPDYSNWLTEGAGDTILLLKDTLLVRHYKLSQWYSVISIPSDASVFAGDSLIGVTPLILRPNLIPPDSSLTIRKKGFNPVSSSLALAARGVLVVPLLPSGEPSEENDWRLASAPGSRKNVLPLWVAGGSALVFGGFSAYYKLAADDQQQAFLATGNPYNAAERSRLDKLSALYFVAAQIGLGAFIAFLLSV
jgi:hypothetical protein